jgi:23S rRNA (guanine745-N1)-methyltransferase
MLPLASSSVDIVSSMFSPLPITEMARVLKAEGFVLVVTPAPTHLWTMREGLFDEVQAHEPDKFLAGFNELFTLYTRSEVSFSLTLPNQALKDLLCMTPYVWKAKPEKRAALELQEQFETTAAFTIFLFRKK